MLPLSGGRCRAPQSEDRDPTNVNVQANDMNGECATTAVDAAAEAGLVYVSDTTAGIRRHRRGPRFFYVGPDNRVVRDPEVLLRISRLAVPPAYEDVWICQDPRGHLQATGRDARGRKQYRYHVKWRATRDDTKFERMLAFADALPRLRRRLRIDLAVKGLPQEKVLAIVVSILDATRVRVGNAEYARTNASYGLTTLRNRHVRFICRDRLVLKFRGKGGADHEIAIDDQRLVRLVRHCHQLRGQHLFQYVDDAGDRHQIDSERVNAYLKEVMGDDFSAKDFRTWGATLRAIVILRSHPVPEPSTERTLAACIVETVKVVAQDLRNTPTVCRKSYINPAVFEAWRSGAMHRLLVAPLTGSTQGAERAAASFLRRHAAKTRSRPARRGRSHPTVTPPSTATAALASNGRSTRAITAVPIGGGNRLDAMERRTQ